MPKPSPSPEYFTDPAMLEVMHRVEPGVVVIPYEGKNSQEYPAIVAMHNALLNPNNPTPCTLLFKRTPSVYEPAVRHNDPGIELSVPDKFGYDDPSVLYNENRDRGKTVLQVKDLTTLAAVEVDPGERFAVFILGEAGPKRQQEVIDQLTAPGGLYENKTILWGDEQHLSTTAYSDPSKLNGNREAARRAHLALRDARKLRSLLHLEDLEPPKKSLEPTNSWHKIQVEYPELPLHILRQAVSYQDSADGYVGILRGMARRLGPQVARWSDTERAHYDKFLWRAREERRKATALLVGSLPIVPAPERAPESARTPEPTPVLPSPRRPETLTPPSTFELPGLLFGAARRLFGRKVREEDRELVSSSRS